MHRDLASSTCVATSRHWEKKRCELGESQDSQFSRSRRGGGLRKEILAENGGGGVLIREDGSNPNCTTEDQLGKGKKFWANRPNWRPGASERKGGVPPTIGSSSGEDMRRGPKGNGHLVDRAIGCCDKREVFLRMQRKPCIRRTLGWTEAT